MIYPDASHTAHVEDPAGYMRVLDDLLRRVESGTWQPAPSSEPAGVTESG